MFGSHVTRQASAYWNNELSPADAQRVGEHLGECSRCRLEFEEIKRGVDLATQIPITSAPETIWTEIETALDRRPTSEPRVAPRAWLPRPALAFACVLGLLLIGGLLFVRYQRTTERPPGWEVERLDGAPYIGSNRIVDKGRLAVGEWLETDGNARAKIDVATIGHVEIDPNTRVRLIETQPSEHRLELARGRMSARISAPPKLFFVNTPSAVAEDLGCAYTLEVDDHGNSLLHVTAGFVSLQLNNRASVVPAGAACMTQPGIGPGTPYFEDATTNFRLALSEFDFNPDQAVKSQALNTIMAEARPIDALTLWYLLSRVNDAERRLVYETMAKLKPPPAGVTREGVTRLDQQMLDKWRNEIDAERYRSVPKAVQDALEKLRTAKPTPGDKK